MDANAPPAAPCLMPRIPAFPSKFLEGAVRRARCMMSSCMLTSLEPYLIALLNVIPALTAVPMGID